MKTIREKIQAMEDEHIDGYKLKTNEEIIDIISEFGNGLIEFHTLDIERLVVENSRSKKVEEKLGQLIDSLDNLAHALKIPISNEMHVELMRDLLPEKVKDLKEVFVEITGENPWE